MNQLKTDFICAIYTGSLTSLEKINKEPAFPALVWTAKEVEDLLPYTVSLDQNKLEILSYLLTQCHHKTEFFPYMEATFSKACLYGDKEIIEYLLSSPQLLPYNEDQSLLPKEARKAQQVICSSKALEGMESFFHDHRKDLLSYIFETIPPGQRPNPKEVVKVLVSSAFMKGQIDSAIYMVNAIKKEEWCLSLNVKSVLQWADCLLYSTQGKLIEFCFHPDQYVNPEVSAKITPLQYEKDFVPVASFLIKKSSPEEFKRFYAFNQSHSTLNLKEKTAQIQELVRHALRHEAAEVLLFLLSASPDILKKHSLVLTIEKTPWVQKDTDIQIILEKNKLTNSLPPSELSLSNPPSKPPKKI